MFNIFKKMKRVVKVEKVEKVEKPEKKVSEFNVFNKEGMFVRSYSTEVHGKEAEQLANQFALKVTGTVK